MLSELRSERAQIEEAIIILERLARGGQKRRGRPPKWMTPVSRESADNTDQPRRKRIVNAEARARMAAAQRKRWAAAKGAKTAEQVKDRPRQE